ncbi:MAG TPA: sugar porter family MFS transporter [Rhodothermales bacterium]|nr:sugar porter family MFS transporter [Rhodothermales bacterium]
MRDSSSTYLGLVSFVAALGGFLFGFDTAVISGAVGYLKTQFDLTAAMEGWLVSSALIGCVLGVLAAGSFSDRFGRKPALMAAAVLFLISAVLSTVPRSFSTLVAARLVGGIGVGIASMLSPLYIAELSPPRLRGRLVSLYQFAITLGILIAYFSNAFWQGLSAGDSFRDVPFLAWILHDEVWRIMFGSETIPAAIFLGLLLWVPRSPRWLVGRGRDKEALAVLSRIGGAEAGRVELDAIRDVVSHGSERLRAVLSPSIRPLLVIGMVLAAASQFSGINVIIYYGPRVFAEAGFTMSDALGAQVTIGVTIVLFTLVAIWKVDHLGRKPLLLAGMSGTILSLAALGLLFYLGRPSGVLVVALILLFCACFSFSYGPVVWVILAEIYPVGIRGRAMSIATMTLWLSNAIVGQTFPWLLENLGASGTFWLFALITLPVVWFVAVVVPETKGKTLEELEVSFRRI